MSGFKRIVLAAVVGLSLAGGVVGGASAFHPGNSDGSPPEVPQGPNHRACENRGGAENPNGKGVFNAIAHGGQVHCHGGEEGEE